MGNSSLSLSFFSALVSLQALLRMTAQQRGRVSKKDRVSKKNRVSKEGDNFDSTSNLHRPIQGDQGSVAVTSVNKLEMRRYIFLFLLFFFWALL